MRVRFGLLLAALVLGGFMDAFAACISPAWVATYNGPQLENERSQDLAFAIATDRFGNVFVTGHGYYTPDGYPDPDMLTVKYDRDGRELWVRAYSFSDRSYDHAAALAVDDDGNVYVTGDAGTLQTGVDIATVKYDPDGNQLWVARYDGPANSSDSPNAIALDKDGNVYVAGYSYGDPITPSGNFDAVLIKYDNQGNELWVARYDGPVHREDRANALALDEQGNAYITGMETIRCFFEPNGDEVCEFDIVTVKYDPAGRQLWVAHFGVAKGLYDTAYAIAVDRLGQVYVTGQSGNLDEPKAITLKYSTEGDLRWAREEPADFPGNFGIAVDAAGMVYTTGYYSPLTKYDPSGRKLWQGTPGHLLKLDSQGNAYVGSDARTIGTDLHFLVTRFDPSGNAIWCGSYDSGATNRFDDPRGLALDADGNVVLTGLTSAGPEQDWNYTTVKFVQPQIPGVSPVVGIIAPDPLAYESPRYPGRNATFLVWRKGQTNAPLTVSYSIGGTAANGVDYQALSGQVTIRAGAYSARVVVQPIDDRSPERAETVRLTLTPSATYLLNSHREAKILIIDNEPWWLSP
jgi:hypothetical protein